MSQMTKRLHVVAHTALFPTNVCYMMKSVMQAKPRNGHIGAQPKGQDCYFAAVTFDIYPDPELYKTNATARGP